MSERCNEVAKLFDLWNEAIQTGDPDKVVALYAFNGVLIPTLSNEVRTSHPAIRDYFVKFLKQKPKAKLDESHVRVYGDVGINSGIYSFYFGASATPTQARYSYAYNWSGDRWLIVEHHSSLLYKELLDRSADYDKLLIEEFNK
jgi:uncharacterized protein (TIGR02246 family)